jgi:hypothetical protein
MIAFTRLRQGEAAIHLVDDASGIVRRLTDPELPLSRMVTGRLTSGGARRKGRARLVRG